MVKKRITTGVLHKGIDYRLLLLICTVVAGIIFPIILQLLLGGQRDYLPLKDAMAGDSTLVWLHLTTNLLIGLSYVAISLTLATLAWRARRDIPFIWMFIAFGAFIFSSAMTHFGNSWAMWTSHYHLTLGIKIVNSLISVTTAAILPSLIPKALDLIKIQKLSVKRKRELERTAKALKRQHDELLALSSAKDDFISLASHQLRTPATGVKQYIGMLLEGYADKLTEEQQAMLQEAYDSNERQLNIVDDLLKVAQVDAGKVILHKQSIDLVTLIQDIINEQVGKFAGRKQKIVFRATTPVVTLTVDPHRIRMALENIIDNASKYSPEGKTVTVRVGQKNSYAIVEIKDQGVGIDKSDMDKLFGKFTRINNPLSQLVGGTGLGLYWVKKIINLHDGIIDIKSRLNRGTTFIVRLPITHEE